MSIAIKQLLLIDEPTVLILKDELLKVAGWFVLPGFVIALCLEYFNEMKFGEVVKKLILILSFIGCFYSFHKTAVDISFQGSEEILKKVSPRNIFLKNWAEVKVRTKTNENWSMLEKFAIPNVNDLLGNFFFVMSKLFIWILKLVYTTVYHLTYVFAPLTAILYFFPITKSSLGGTIQSSLWCMFMPIVLVSILAIVGNSIQAPAASGELSIITIDQILWLFGVTFLLLMSPVLTLGLLRGGGVAMAGSAVGAMMTSSAMKVLKASPNIASGLVSTTRKAKNIGSKTLLEPSIRDLIRQEKSPDTDKLKLLDQKGGIRNPFKAQKGMDERLEKVGMTKSEAFSLVKMPMSKMPNSNGGYTHKPVSNVNEPLPELYRNSQVDKSLIKQSSSRQKGGISERQNIAGNLFSQQKKHHPVSRANASSTRYPLLNNTTLFNDKSKDSKANTFKKFIRKKEK